MAAVRTAEPYSTTPDASSAPLLEIRDIALRFGGIVALDGV
ncbi:MAG: ABC transporter ATP-binding protein, partial [Alphaproteobacteria bacterium]|nr:ABC transporter ATP-binding protein [Alphaproteobacteria bacterium]